MSDFKEIFMNGRYSSISLVYEDTEIPDSIRSHANLDDIKMEGVHGKAYLNIFGYNKFEESITSEAMIKRRLDQIIKDREDQLKNKKRKAEYSEDQLRKLEDQLRKLEENKDNKDNKDNIKPTNLLFKNAKFVPFASASSKPTVSLGATYQYQSIEDTYGNLYFDVVEQTHKIIKNSDYKEKRTSSN